MFTRKATLFIFSTCICVSAAFLQPPLCIRSKFEPKLDKSASATPLKTTTTQMMKTRSQQTLRMSSDSSALSGIWWSDDFYGPHGREYVEIGVDMGCLTATKVTGDANVPRGRVTWRTRGLPGVGSTAGAEVQIRADPSDPNGFSWATGFECHVKSEKLIYLSGAFEGYPVSGHFEKRPDPEIETLNEDASSSGLTFSLEKMKQPVNIS
eukprot:CAMPEP_0181322882 /NCGR_PEP_ID=MMETSP1101-20121128/19472_1 /TAXON_ID=46948 /ORGANISM="Rhodomonas abbreviata, Strain Caron Lab Isolate" /LENGTH=208 /DNA_ID=CAMNT_0023430839 /DNA_START=29 /DNA_END=655 /DNA_ORIENTATION=+